MNGTSAWFNVLVASTCPSNYYKQLQYNPTDAYVYAFGAGLCGTATSELAVNRHFVIDGSLDLSWSLVVSNDLEQDSLDAAVIDF